MPPTPAEIEAAMRLCAARVLQGINCPCDNCFKATVACSTALNALAWACGLPLDRRHLTVSKPHDDQIAGLADNEQVATYLSDPRMREILPDYTFPEVKTDG